MYLGSILVVTVALGGLLDYLLTLIELDPVTQATQVQGAASGLAGGLSSADLNFSIPAPLTIQAAEFLS